MIRRVVAASLLLVAASSFAHGPHTVYLPIAGSVGVFRTDVRLFNPTSAPVSLAATFIPVCTLSGAVPAYQVTCGGTPLTATFLLQSRQMRVIDDAVSSAFGGSGIGAIRIAGPAEGIHFDATARIYASVAGGTLGQFSTGRESHSGLFKGVLLHLKQNSAFRTNIGLLNPSSIDTVNLTLKLFDRNSAAAGEITIALPPGAVLGPTSIATLFGSGADLSDSFITFASQEKVVAYASVIDNVTTDPMFIDAVHDALFSGVGNAQ